MVVSSRNVAPGAEAVSLTIDLPKRTIIEFQRELNKVPDKVRKKVARELRTALQGPAAKVVAAFPREAPMSGMTARWGYVKSTIRTNPNAPDGRAIALIGIAGEDKGFNRTVAITERAGSRSPGLTPWGRKMTSVLQDRYPLVGKGGRFIWKAWLKYRPEAVRAVLTILDSFVNDYNRKVR